MKSFRILTAALTALLLAAPLLAGPNDSVHIDAGDTLDRGVSSLNGRIQVDGGARINGEVESVNGSIRIGRDAQIEAVSSVNGSIKIGDGTEIQRKVSSVNGSISLERDARAQGVASVNGSIELRGADIDDNIETYNGRVEVLDGSRVGGDILVRERDGTSRQSQPLRIVIDGSQVDGDVINEEDRIEVEVVLRNGGQVAGEIRGAEVVQE